MENKEIFSKSALKALIIPLLVEQVLAVTVGLSDVMMVSNVGEAAISGVSLVDMINNLMIAIFAALATGGAVVTAQCIGAGHYEEARKSAKQLIIVAITLSIVIMAGCLIFNRHILRILFGSIDNDVMHNAMLYFLISSASYPFLALYNSCAALFRSMGNSAISMKVSILMNVINICGNAILIFVFKMGVEGVAIPSLVSRFIAAIIMLVLIRNKKNVVYVDHQNFKPEFGMIRRILYIAIPSGMENGIFQFGRIIVVSIISTFGTVQIAANAVANSIDGMGTLCGQAISLAMITVVGQCVGAGDLKQVRLYTKKLLKIAYILTICVNSTILLTLPWILKIFSLSDETRSLAFILICIHNGCAILLWPLSFVLPNALRACNDVKYTMVVSIFSMCMFRIVFSYIIGQYFGMGAIGVWIAMIIDWIFRVIFFVYRFVSGKWEKLTYANR